MRRFLKSKREIAGLTQEQIAKKIGIGTRMYQYIEHCHRNPSWEVAQRLEQFFGIPASKLLAETESDDKSTGIG